jgi:hypothetical protein
MNPDSALYTMCSDPAAAQRAVDALLAVGVNTENITVISSEPFDGFEFSRHEKATLMPWLAVLGAILSGAGGFLLVSQTQKSYPIVTGGMAIVTPWSDGIITYELTMLGAILTTLLVLILTAPLLRWKLEPYDEQVADGKILVGVTHAPAQLQEDVKQIFSSSGGT